MKNLEQQIQKIVKVCYKNNISKFCIKCKKTLNINRFYKRGNICKQCTSINRKQYYSRNKEKIVARNKLNYKKNIDHILTRRKKYKKNNKEKINELSKKYRAKHRDAISKRRWKYYQNNIQAKIAKNLRRRLNHVIKNGYKTGSAVRDLGCSINYLKVYLEDKFKPGMSWDNYGPIWHIDHVKPLSKFNLEDREQLLKACHYTNLQPLFAKENIVKHNKIGDDQCLS